MPAGRRHTEIRSTKLEWRNKKARGAAVGGVSDRPDPSERYREYFGLDLTESNFSHKILCSQRACSPLAKKR
jgi:hypothetical protein